MRRLIFGAGVLGTFYAVKLLACGHDVTGRWRCSRQLWGNDHLSLGERERPNTDLGSRPGQVQKGRNLYRFAEV